MAQLVAAVSATVKRWKVDEIPDARYVKAGDEIVEVLTRYPSRGVIRVLRGAEDSTAASHDAGTELESPLMGGAGGAEQTIRLLGPFAIAYNTPDLFNTEAPFGTELTQLTAGQTVIAAWLVTTGAVFSGGGATTCDIDIVIGGLPANQAAGEAWSDGYYWTIARCNAREASHLSITPEPIRAAVSLKDTAADAAQFALNVPVLCLTDAVLAAWGEHNGSGLTNGQAAIYALVAEPA